MYELFSAFSTQEFLQFVNANFSTKIAPKNISLIAKFHKLLTCL